MTSEFEGKICIVTGGSSGIGLATAKRFAAEGAVTVVCAREPVRLTEAVAQLRKESRGPVHEQILDVSDFAAVEAAVAEIGKRFGGVHVLVNNAFSQIGGTVAGTSVKEWHDNFGATLHGALYMTHCAIPLMRHAGGGAIVNVSSMSGSVVTPGTCGYASAKAGLEQLTRVVAIEEAAYNIRANAIIVGGIDTPALQKTLPDGYDGLAKMIPVGRVGEPNEVANVIRFLVSSEASYVTAATLRVDGGFSVAMGHGISQSNFKSSDPAAVRQGGNIVSGREFRAEY